MMPNSVNAFFLSLTCLLTLVACGEEPAPKASGVPTVEGQRLTLAPDDDPGRLKKAAVTRDTGHDLRLSGRLVWNEDTSVRVFPPVAGRVAGINAKPGDQVRAGTRLLSLSSPDFGQARADLGRAEADFRLAEKALARTRELHTAGVVAQKDLDQAEADFSRASAERARAQARVKGMGGDGPEQTFAITSPINGIVVERNANPGQEIKPETLAAPLFVVTDPTTLWVQVEAREDDLAAARPGVEIGLELAAYPGQRLSARIEHVADFVDPATRTIKVRARVANPERRLKAEMFVIAVLPVTASDSLQVPARAVLLQGSERYVMVELGARQFERRRVEVGREHDGLIDIKSGVSEGEQVLVEGNLQLATFFKPGAK